MLIFSHNHSDTLTSGTLVEGHAKRPKHQFHELTQSLDFGHFEFCEKHFKSYSSWKFLFGPHEIRYTQSRDQYGLCVWIIEEHTLAVLSGLLNWETTWCTLHMDSERCVIQWLMGDGCHAWRQYRFSEMTEPKGVTLKCVPDISRLVCDCSGSRSSSLSVCSFYSQHIPLLYSSLPLLPF